MSETITQLHARKSVRAFTDEPVSEQDELAILEAACQAPTAGNQQLYSIIVARSQQQKDALAKSCDKKFIARAPLVLVFCADVRRWYEAFAADDAAEPRKPGVGDALLAVVDATVAAQNAVVAAEVLGLGSCYIGDILENAEVQRDILALPPYVMPACMLVIGHPTQQLNRTKPRRFKLGTVVFEDRYRVQEASEVAEAIAYKNEGRRETIAQFCARKWNSGFSREMTRSVRVWLSGFPFEG